VVLGSLGLVGIPVGWLLNGRRSLTQGDHILAPFLGMGAIVLVLQNLVYLDVTIRHATPFLWAAILLAWTCLFLSGKLGANLKKWPWELGMACMLAYLVQGAGLLTVGADLYAGRAWTDQFNYTAMAQSYMDVPFTTSWESLGNRPYLIPGINFREDRLGQSILQGFFATSCHADAKSLFEPTILLCPCLSVLAVFMVGRRFGLAKSQALIAGLTAGLLPSLALMHLECFFSHALALPFLILWPLVVNDLAKQLDWHFLGKAVLVFIAIASIYTEFLPILFGIVLISLSIVLPRHAHPWRLLGYHGALMFAPFVLNPGSSASILHIFARLDLPVLDTMYPWAFSLEGVGRIWLGDFASCEKPSLQSLTRAYSLGVTILASWGLLKSWLDRFSWTILTGKDIRQRHDLAFASTVSAVALIPLLIVAKDDQHPYQYYKMLLSVSPLLVLGLALAWKHVPVKMADNSFSGSARTALSLAGVPFLMSFGVVLPVASAATGWMTLESGKCLAHPRSFISVCLGMPDIRALQVRLGKLPQSRLVCAFGGLPEDFMLNSWLSYFGRRHEIWLASPIFVDHRFADEKGSEIVQVNRLPADVLVLSRSIKGFQSILPGDLTPIWSGESFQLAKASSHNWAVPLTMTIPNGLEGDKTHPFFWIGPDPAAFEVLAGAPGHVTLSALFTLGPSLPETCIRRLRVSTSAGDESEFLTRGGHGTLIVPVAAGKTTIKVVAIDRATQPAVPGRDPRALLLGISGLTFTYGTGTDLGQKSHRCTRFSGAPTWQRYFDFGPEDLDSTRIKLPGWTPLRWIATDFRVHNAE
jgi:hypothetical protein